MAEDPWARPSVQDLQQILESIDERFDANLRTAERLDLNVPAEITTQRGNVISAMTREISRDVIGLVHRGSIQPGPVRIKMASETREFDYNVQIEWCTPANNGMFLSGGRFLRRALPGTEIDDRVG